MATRRYKSKKHLSKKHGKKSKNHKKQVKKTRKYRKKRGGGPMADKDYVPQYQQIIDLLDKIGKGNDQTETMTSVNELNDLLKEYKNPVSCTRRFLYGDNLNCHKQKNMLYKKIKAKIVETREKFNTEEKSSLDDTKVEAIIKTLNNAHNHFATKMGEHLKLK